MLSYAVNQAEGRGMHEPRSALVLYLLILAGALAAHGDDEGGLLGGLNRAGPPPRNDGTPPPRDQPAAPQNPERPATTAPATAAQGRLEESIRRMDERVRGLQEAMRQEPQPLTTDQLQRRRDQLQEAYNRMAGDVRNVESQEMSRLRTKMLAAMLKHGPLVGAIRAGKKPADMSPEDWARACDEFALTAVGIEAETAELAERLRTQREEQLTPLANELKALEREIADAGKPDTMARRRQLARQAQLLELHLARQRLRELQQLGEEAYGRQSARADFIVNFTLPRSNDPVDVLNWLATTIATSNQGAPEPTSARLADGVPLADWQDPKREFTAEDRLQAKLRWLNQCLATVHHQQAHLDEELAAADAEQLASYARELRAADRVGDPQLRNVELTRRRDAQLAEKRREFEQSRAQRRTERTTHLNERRQYYVEQIAAENARVDSARRHAAPPATRPGQ